MEEAPHIEGWVNTKIQYKYNLKPKTSPSDYADMLLPTKNIGVKINAVLSTIDTVKNMNTSLERSVPDGACYQELKIFNTPDIHHQVGLYIFHVIYPSPQLKMKF